MAFKETYNIDAKQAEAALRGLIGDTEKLAKASEEATKKLSAEDKAARRIAEGADPMKRFNRQLEETAVLVSKGKVSFDDANTSLGRYAERISGAGKAQEATFGQKAISSIASYAAGFVSLQAGISVVTSLFTTLRNEADAAAERIKASLDAVGELQQIEGFQENTDFIKELRKRGVVKDASQGAALANNLDQAGFNQQEQEFIAYDLIKSRFLNATDGADVATKFAKVNDLLQIGSLEDTIQKIVQAGGSTSSTNPEFADAMTVFAGQFKGLGYSADESMAAAEIADKNSKNILAAAERLKSFADQVAKRQLGTGSFMGDINSIRDRVRGGENIYDILGEANAVAGYQLFDEDREQAKYLKSKGLVSTASQRDVLGNQLGGIYKDPIYAAAINQQAAKGSLEVAQEEQTAELTLLYQEMRARDKQFTTSRDGRFFAGMNDTSYDMWAGLTMERSAIGMRLDDEFAQGNRGDGGAFSKEFEERLLGYLERTANNTDPQTKPSAE